MANSFPKKKYTYPLLVALALTITTALIWTAYLQIQQTDLAFYTRQNFDLLIIDVEGISKTEEITISKFSAVETIKIATAVYPELGFEVERYPNNRKYFNNGAEYVSLPEESSLERLLLAGNSSLEQAFLNSDLNQNLVRYIDLPSTIAEILDLREEFSTDFPTRKTCAPYGVGVVLKPEFSIEVDGLFDTPQVDIFCNQDSFLVFNSLSRLTKSTYDLTVFRKTEIPTSSRFKDLKGREYLQSIYTYSTVASIAPMQEHRLLCTQTA